VHLGFGKITDIPLKKVRLGFSNLRDIPYHESVGSYVVLFMQNMPKRTMFGPLVLFIYLIYLVVIKYVIFGPNTRRLGQSGFFSKLLIFLVLKMFKNRPEPLLTGFGQVRGNFGKFRTGSPSV
jgi:hypothetical protein